MFKVITVFILLTLPTFSAFGSFLEYKSWKDDLDISSSKLISNWANYVGGTEEDEILGVVNDGSGDFIVTGRTRSSKFLSIPSRNIGPRGDYDVFVAKLSSSQNQVLWVTFIGGSSWDEGRAIAVDGENNVIITGYTESRDFPTVNPFQGQCTETAYYGCGEAIFVKLNPSGEALFSSYFGASVGSSIIREVGNAVAVDADGNTWIVTGGSSSDIDAWVVKIGPDGQKKFAKRIGGNNLDSAQAITIDSDGNAIIAGVTYSDDFPTTANAFQKETGGGTLTAIGGGGPFPIDAFVVKITSFGSTIFSTFLGGKGDEEATGVAVDENGDIYVVGETSSNDFPIKDAFQDVFKGPGGTHPGQTARGDAFITKILKNGETLVYSTFLGGQAPDIARGVVVDNTGSAIVLGTSQGDFPELGEIVGPAVGGDCFLSKMEDSGKQVAYSVRVGEDCTGLVLSLNGDPLIVGNTFGELLGSGPGQLEKPGFQDGYLMQFVEPKLLYFPQFGDGGEDHYFSDIVLVNPSASVEVNGTADFRDDDGFPLEIGFQGLGSVIGPVSLSVPPLAAVTISTAGQGNLKIGSVVVTSDGILGGVVRFNLPGIGVAGVGASRASLGFITPVRREINGVNTGIALMNPGPAAVDVNLTLRDEQGQEVATAYLKDISSRGHIARFINELFPEADTEAFRGSLVLEASAGEIAVVALELDALGAKFTTLPVTPLQ